VNYECVKVTDKIQQEKLDICGECGRKASRARHRHVYCERYPDRNHPLAYTFENICRKFLETGSLNPNDVNIVNK
jgi:predicted amidophosphoribosyltransferase